jgi:DNA-directed RNA polymerase subunit H (RpoH/RPB5)
MRSQFILPYVGVIKPTDKIPLGSYMEEIEEQHRKSIDPVTGRLFLKYSLQDDLNDKLERETALFEERFGHIEPNHELEALKEEAQEQYKIIGEMTMDSDKVMPNDRMRHWMVAQSHIVMRDGGEEVLDELEIQAKINAEVEHDDPLAKKTFERPSDVQKARAKRAYDSITEMISKKEIDSDNLFEDLISEKAMVLDRFAEDAVPTPQDQLINYAKDQMTLKNKGQETDVKLDDDFLFDPKDAKIKAEIQRIMEEYAAPKAKGKREQFSKYEEDEYGESLIEPVKQFGSK